MKSPLISRAWTATKITLAAVGLYFVYSTTMTEARMQEPNTKRAAIARSDTNTIRTDTAKAQVESKEVRLLRAQGRTNIQLRKFKEAAEDFKKALVLDPDDAKIYNDRASMHIEMKRYELAIADLTKAIRLDPKYAAAYNNRAGAYIREFEFELALADYSKAIELEPGNSTFYYNRGRRYLFLKDEWEGAGEKGKADLNKANLLDSLKRSEPQRDGPK